MNNEVRLLLDLLDEAFDTKSWPGSYLLTLHVGQIRLLQPSDVL
jgi:hypothetical protein